ncbi:helix-turn-helix domain-containing protein [Geobacillus sp. FSL K6-0789]|uniref:Fis-type helix-turn-helix domain protein n=1 Tax=Geobacillus stearothermophilus TaxID=1422 RepID=A0A087LCB3_GEOSE|nr:MULTISPECIES: helix-turn-helix domain-containing protein [Geobacillus]AKU27232.1 PucR family transcriptional regulator [Geobacillus sp. LC300]MED0653821.1 helix-turn-helix domain-containing protein [Anoxybacillus geothermalis]KAF6511116.1 Fis-type helix-turn-helix domain protein [Geobacillus stearothermophilus]KFL15266.1 PucR family transcriptional regulator [Geobacillus stearothermophilus]KFX33367.1 PucR family transcriptional regulator [Geobacillus stearothermophilus]
MLKELESLYKGDIIINGQPADPEAYEWFYTAGGDEVGIAKERLTERERQLLALLLTPANRRREPESEEERAWKQWMATGRPDAPAMLSAPYCRFIHFLVNRPIANKQEFAETIHNLFASRVLIVWNEDKRGLLIEAKQKRTAEPLLLAEMADALAADFYATMHLLIGPVRPVNGELYESFLLEQQCFAAARRFWPKQTVYEWEDVIPLPLLESAADDGKTGQILSFLDGLGEEEVRAMETFLECNLNVSMAAKKLYMHRNSLQYRIDKWAEQTGIDIKRFKGAAAAYLAILHQRRA